MQVTQKHFGSVYSGFPQESHHTQVLEALGTYVSRWPGGHLSEVRTDVYDITTNSVFDPTDLYSTNPDRNRLDLSEVLHLSIDSPQTISIVIPTYRYVDNIDGGAQDLQIFLENLVENFQGFDIRLEIGSEYYASENLTAEKYGEMALRFAQIVHSHQNLGINFETVIQMGRSSSENEDILSHFRENMELVDNLSVHILPINISNLYRARQDGELVDRFDVLEQNVAEWRNAAWQSGFSEPTVVMSAWSIGEATSNPNDVDLSFQDYGARGGVTTLALFAEAVGSGVEEASIWGVGEAGLSSLGRVVDNEVSLTHSGVIFKELSDSVVGLNLVSMETDYFNWQEGPQVGTVTFSGLGTLVIYVGYGEDQVSGVLNLENRSQGFSSETARIVETRSISTVYEMDYEPQNSEFDRLFELPSVQILNDSRVNLDGVWLSHQQSVAYEILEVTVSWRHDGTWESETLTGYASSDWFDGAGGNDTIYGFANNDTLEGSAGDDYIVGGSGDDILNGGDGADVLIGDEEEGMSSHNVELPIFSIGDDFGLMRKFIVETDNWIDAEPSRSFDDWRSSQTTNICEIFDSLRVKASFSDKEIYQVPELELFDFTVPEHSWHADPKSLVALTLDSSPLFFECKLDDFGYLGDEFSF